MIFSYIIRCVSLSAAAPPAPTKIMRNVITHCASAPKLAAASLQSRDFASGLPPVNQNRSSCDAMLRQSLYGIKNRRIVILRLVDAR
jgi:hypothetical protein